MRVLVLGAGATGGWFGAGLIASGAEVSFLVRPRRAAELERRGLVVHAAGATARHDVRALTAIPAGARYDLVLLSCKAYDLETAIAAVSPAMQRGAVLLPLLNGMRHLEPLDATFGVERVLGGLCHISATLDEDATIRQMGSLARLTFGQRPSGPAVPAVVRDGLQSAAFETIHSADVLSAMWEKFIFLSALAGITCLLEASIGAIVAVPDGRELTRRIYLECAEVARRSGYPPAAEAMSEALDILAAPRSPLQASMLRDMQRGQRTEVEHVLGDMLERAATLGIDTPLLAVACARLRIHEADLAGAAR